MDDKILDGKKLSEDLLCKVHQQAIKSTDRPSLAALLIGDNASSQLYIKLKKKACEKCGIDFHQYFFEENCTEKEILETINFLNNDPNTNAILVQLPLPDKYDTDKIIEAIDYKKDIDGFHPKNRANMQKCVYKVLPPLPAGIIELVKTTKDDITNKKITILCNNKMFGDPFRCIWGKANQVTVITTEDQDWKEQIKSADLLIVSIGIPYFITKDMIKVGVIIIDVGINKLDNGEVVGDVNFADVLDKVKFISPVPGGVGPMTVATLLMNLIKLSKLSK